MVKKLFQLFKIARKISCFWRVGHYKSKFMMFLYLQNLFMGFFQSDLVKINSHENKRPGEKLCDALESMGTTFIKLGQFLATNEHCWSETSGRFRKITR